MKIFKESSTVSSSKSKEASAPKEAKTISRKKAAPPEKKSLSAQEIKDKLAVHVETSDVSKNMAIKNTKKMGEGFLNDEFKAPPVIAPKENIVTEKKDEASEEVSKDPNKKDFVLQSDIALNDPKDTNTQEKLKTVLSKGAFNFNPKERDALEKILANQ